MRQCLDRTFDELYACSGRPLIPHEQLLRALLLEQLDYNMLYRWFVGLVADDLIWCHTSFGKNRERLLNEKVLSCFWRSFWGWKR